MNSSNGSRITCPRCGVSMEHWVEIEIFDGGKKIKYYYKCPRCSYRVNDLILSVKRRNGTVIIIKEEYKTPIKSRVGNIRKANNKVSNY